MGSTGPSLRPQDAGSSCSGGPEMLAHVTKIWLLLAVMMVLPPLLSALFDGEGALPTDRLLMPGQAIVGLSLGLASFVSIRKGAVHVSLLVAAVVATAFGVLATIVDIPYVGQDLLRALGALAYIGLFLPTGIVLAMTIATFVAYVRSGTNSN